MIRSIDFGKVADIYDSYVRADFDIDFWLNEACRQRGRVLELTAGTGRVSVPLLRAGVDLTCVDYCPEMLAVLKRKVSHEGFVCNIIEMDITELSLPIQYDLIFIPFNSFSEIIDRKSQRRTLVHIKQHLAEGGVFFCTLQNPAVKAVELDGRLGNIGTFASADGGTLTVAFESRYEKTSGLVHGFQHYEFRDKYGKSVGRRKMEINFRLLGREEFEDTALDAGLEVVDLYGNYDYAKFNEVKSPYMIWRMKAIQN